MSVRRLRRRKKFERLGFGRKKRHLCRMLNVFGTTIGLGLTRLSSRSGNTGDHTPLEAAQTIIRNRVKQEENELSARLPDTYNSVRYGGKVPDRSDMVEIDRIWKSYRSK